MLLVRRGFLHLIAAAAIVPPSWRVALGQAPGGLKLTQILRADLQGQEHKVQETIVNALDLSPGAAAPWHMHPGAQELLYVLAGDITVEVEGQALKLVKSGEIALIPADVPHLARNESTSAPARALVVHSRSDKEKPLVVPVKRAA
jgi:quercetin dioxygenase-like cupin family protein